MFFYKFKISRSRLPVLILDLQLKEEKLVDNIQLRIFGSQVEC